MNGIEVEAAIFKHELSRMCQDMEVKKKVAMSRRVEQQQQKMINWLIPSNESPIENTIGYEQLAVDLTAGLAEMVSDPYVKQVFDFGLLEDFDHLYRYANLLDLVEGKNAEDIVKGQTEITLGRPTVAHHRHPFDSMRKYADVTTSKPLDILCIMTLVSAEQQTMNFYMNTGNRATEATSRGLYQEIGMVEEQHVSQYENLMDPRCTWYEMMVLHEYLECWLYHSLMQQEPDPKVKMIWEICLLQELEHLKMASSMLQKMEKKDAQELVPAELPQDLVLRSHTDYVRNILATQVNLTANGTEIVPMNQLPDDSRFAQYQTKVNDIFVPSQNIIQEHIQKIGQDYRLELKGPHPVESYRDRTRVPLSEDYLMVGMDVADQQGNPIGQVGDVVYNKFVLNRKKQQSLDVPLDAVKKSGRGLQLSMSEKQLKNISR
jgi:rubrerythrin